MLLFSLGAYSMSAQVVVYKNFAMVCGDRSIISKSLKNF